MKFGKVPPEVLKIFVYPFSGTKRNEVLVHSSFGEDCSVIDFGDYVAVLSTDPITCADKNSGSLSVYVACNDIAACGAEPIGILVTLLLPIGSDREVLKDIIKTIHEAAKKINIEVLGGHTEVTPAVTKPVISATAIGIAAKHNYVTSSGAKPGDDVIVTKYLGLEGTFILASDFGDYLKEKLNESVIDNALTFIDQISVIEDGLVAAAAGVTAMHDITEGGLLGACFEVAEASGTGMDILRESLPILQETASICELFDIDPLGLISSGSMLITSTNGKKVIKALNDRGINAHIIGKVTEGGNYIVSKGRKVPFVPPDRDELYKAIEGDKE